VKRRAVAVVMAGLAALLVLPSRLAAQPKIMPVVG